MTNPAVEQVQARVDELTGRLKAALCREETSGHVGARREAARERLCFAAKCLLFGDLDGSESFLNCVDGLLAE